MSPYDEEYEAFFERLETPVLLAMYRDLRAIEPRRGTVEHIHWECDGLGVVTELQDREISDFLASEPKNKEGFEYKQWRLRYDQWFTDR